MISVPSFAYYGNFLPGVAVPTPIFIAVICMILAWALLRFTNIGLYSQAVGINASAARLNGIHPQFVKFLTYVILGLCVAVAGFIKVSRFSTINYSVVAKDIEMDAILAVALGGNALGNTPYEQLALVTETAKPIVDLIAQGNEVIIAHGNGPQVGMINLGMATAAEAKAIKSDMPFPECGAMSQGYIGYHLQNAIGNELASRGMNKDVATVVTQVLVDEADPAFQHPTKPVGAFYDKETADRIAAEKGYTMVEDAGRGYRQVVPSPKPIDVIEKNTVKALVDNGTVVITVGGGGIPVVCRDGKLYGTPAVIDKDFASAKLAELLDADMLVILTAVEKVAINFGKPDQKGLDTLTPDEARRYIDEKQFAPGSMLPKVQAAMSFAESKPGRVALITLLEKAAEGIEGKTGTRVQM